MVPRNSDVVGGVDIGVHHMFFVCRLGGLSVSCGTRVIYLLVVGVGAGLVVDVGVDVDVCVNDVYYCSINNCIVRWWMEIIFTTYVGHCGGS